MNIRKEAAQVLHLNETKGSYSDILLDNIIRSSHIETNDRRLLTEIVYGTLRNKIRLDNVIYGMAQKKRKIDPFTLSLLRISAYQILFLEKVPDFAAIDEAVKIIKKTKKSFLSGFVNALLRNISREKERILTVPEPKDSKELASFFSYPLWLTEYLVEKMGVVEAGNLLSYLHIPPGLTVRCTHLAALKDLERSFDEDGVVYERLPCEPPMYNIKPKTPLTALKSYREGLFIVQSVASAMIEKVLSPKEGDTVLDLCAAPGTKSVQIAAAIGGGGRVIACDLYPKRLKKVQENLTRLRLGNVKVLACDAAAALPFKSGLLFDRILLDVPCSGLGTLKKTPELKYKVDMESVKELSRLQYSILENAAFYLKEGGKIVYSTCSILEEENERVIKKFLESNSGYVLEEIIDDDLLRNKMVDENGYFKTVPHIHLTDGFFAAVIVKRKRGDE